MRRTTTGHLGGRVGASALLLLALSAMTMIFAANASAFTDVNTITGTETWPNVTQTGSVIATKPGSAQVLVAYNDGRGAMESPANYLGLSISSNNGESFFRLGQPTQFTGHGTGYGSPILAWDQKRNRWIVGQLSSGCGGKGIGLWFSTNGTTWTEGPCAHSGTKDEEPSMWIDNNPASPRYGRIYISYGEQQGTEAGEIGLVRSDDGSTWTKKTAFGWSFGVPRNMNITGSFEADGTIWNAVMIESGPTGGTQSDIFVRSTDGGETWTIFSISNFGGAGGTTCAGSLAVTPNWSHPGWGQIAVGPSGTVGYIFAWHGAGSDESDVYYTRFNGTSWSSPVKLNTDGTTKAQWQPSLRISQKGVVEATWYDRRNSTNGTNYQRFSRFSYDNGLTWKTDQPLSSTLIPQPSQPNPNLPACVGGGGDLASASSTLGFDTWTDGRVVMSSTNVAKVFFRAAVLTRQPTVTTEPATVSGTSATLFGKVDPHGLETTYQFQYGTTTSYGNVVPLSPAGLGSLSEVTVSQGISGLASATTYHFRIMATNSEGTSFGEDRTFVTK
jgi:hypothetical protein